jgi:hypothetical protein
MRPTDARVARKARSYNQPNGDASQASRRDVSAGISARSSRLAAAPTPSAFSVSTSVWRLTG